jgi:hypothetical protein
MKTEFELARERREAREQKREAAEPPLHLASNAQRERREAAERHAPEPRAGFRGETDDGVEFE